MAQRATSLGTKPSLFVFVLFFCFVFCFLVVWYKKNLVFPPRKGHFLFIFSVCLSFSLSLFWPPPFSVSLSLSLSFLLFFLSSFLSFLFAFFWFLVFVSFFLSLSSLLFFHERNNIKILNCKVCLHQYVLCFGFPVFFLFQVPFSYLCYFLILSYVFCSTSRFWVSKQTTKKTFFGQRGVTTKRLFFINLCFGMCEKLAHFFGKFWLMLKKHYKTRYFSTLLKAKIW